jgi:hypothetical protein
VISAETISPERIGALLGRIGGQRPLVHHITNPVNAAEVPGTFRLELIGATAGLDGAVVARRARVIPA